MEKFHQPNVQNDSEEEVDMSRRGFIKKALATTAAVAMTGLPVGEAEAFGSLSVEKYKEYVDKIVVPQKFGDEEHIKQEMKEKYETLSRGQKMAFSTLVVCNMGGVPTLSEYNAQSGGFKIDCMSD